jgi:hypothetical protein
MQEKSPLLDLPNPKLTVLDEESIEFDETEDGFIVTITVEEPIQAE